MNHFDWIAPYYERWFGGAQRVEWLRLLDIPPQGCLLDVGGGTGRVARHLQAYLACPIVVIDVSLGMLRQVSCKDGLRPICAASEALPFSLTSFERVIMVDTLHHVADQQETAYQIWQVLKPGGRILIEEPDIRRFGVKLIALAEKLLGMRSHILDIHQMAGLFKGLPARISTEARDNRVWLVVEKQIAEGGSGKEH